MPTLLATRLQLELLLSEHAVDLRAAAGILLNDPGATLQIFRRAAEEADGGVPPNRLEDCLALLSTEAWLEAVNASAVERAADSPATLSHLMQFWEHARSIAYTCWLLAARFDQASSPECAWSDHALARSQAAAWPSGGAPCDFSFGPGGSLCPEEAYLAGLLHEAAELPRLLGWAPAQFGMAGAQWTPSALGQLAAHFHLPAFLTDLFVPAGSLTQWQPLLEAAHTWSDSLALSA